MKFFDFLFGGLSYSMAREDENFAGRVSYKDAVEHFSLHRDMLVQNSCGGVVSLPIPLILRVYRNLLIEGNEEVADTFRPSRYYDYTSFNADIVYIKNKAYFMYVWDMVRFKSFLKSLNIKASRESDGISWNNDFINHIHASMLSELRRRVTLKVTCAYRESYGSDSPEEW